MVIFSAILIGALFIFSTLSGVRNFNLRLVKMLHLLQLEDYDPIRMLSTQVKRLNISKEIGLELGATLIAFSAMLLFGLLSMDHNPIADNYALLFFVGISIFSFALWLVGSGRERPK